MRSALLPFLIRSLTIVFVASGLLALDGAANATGQVLNQITFAGLSLGPANVPAGSTNVPILRLTTTVSSGHLRLDTFIVRRTGASSDSDIGGAGLRLWRDVNGTGAVEGADRLLDSKDFLGGAAQLNANLEIDWFLPAQLLITLDLRDTAVPGTTIVISIDDRTEVVAQSDPIITGIPTAADSFTIGAPPNPIDSVSASGSGSAGLTVSTADGVIGVQVPPGASQEDISVVLETVPTEGMPLRSGDAVTVVYRLSVESNGAGASLASPVRIEIDLASLLGDLLSATPGLGVVSLGEDGIWRSLASARSADGTALIVSGSQSTTFSIVSLAGAGAGLIPPQSGVVASADGSTTATLPPQASDTAVLVTVTPSAAPPPALPGGATPVGEPVVFHQEDPASGEAADLSVAVTVTLPASDPAAVPGCDAQCDIVAYAVPTDGSPPAPLPTRLSEDGAQVLVDVRTDVTIVLAAGPDLAAAASAPGEAGSATSADGVVSVSAGPGASQTQVTIGPSSVDQAAAGQIPASLIATPLSVTIIGGDDRDVRVTIDLSQVPTGANREAIVAYGLEPGSDTPLRLPAVVDQQPGVIRIAISSSLTIYLGETGETRAERLQPGWNLITVRGGDGAPPEFLATQFDGRLLSISRWNAALGDYETYTPTAPGPHSLRALNDGDAVWAWISPGEDYVWTRPIVPLPARRVTLSPGWNLVSWSGPSAPPPAPSSPSRAPSAPATAGTPSRTRCSPSCWPRERPCPSPSARTTASGSSSAAPRPSSGTNRGSSHWAARHWAARGRPRGTQPVASLPCSPPIPHRRPRPISPRRLGPPLPARGSIRRSGSTSHSPP